jgi:hypothetical protein
MPDEGFGNAFSHHATAEQIAFSAAVQRPIEQMHSRAGSNTGVEIQTFLVPDCRGEPHHQPQNATLYGETNESNNKVARRRSHTTAECATESCGHHHGSEAGSVLLSGR